jgi:transposase
MAVSLELSSIQHNQAESARLAAAMDEFLSRGGKVSEVAGPIPAPRPYGYRAAPAPVGSPDRKPLPPRRSKKETMQRLRIVPDIEEAKAKAQTPKAPPADLDRVRELAKTMSQREVAEHTGIHRKQLYSMARAYGFEFQKSAHGGAANLVHNQIDPIKDAKNAERIKAMRDIGVSQRQAAAHMGIGRTYFRKLLVDFRIYYPAPARNAPAKTVAS